MKLPILIEVEIEKIKKRFRRRKKRNIPALKVTYHWYTNTIMCDKPDCRAFEQCSVKTLCPTGCEYYDVERQTDKGSSSCN